MRLVRPGFEFRVELHADEEVVLRHLDRLDDPAVRRRAADAQPGFGQHRAVVVVELVAVAVALVDVRGAVAARHLGIRRNLAGIAAEAQRAAHVDLARLVGHEVDDLVLPDLVELAGIRVLDAADVARVFDDGDLHAEADAEVRHIVLARILCREDHALDAAVTEPAGHEDAVAAGEHRRRVLRRDPFGVDPVDLDARAVLIARVAQRLRHGKVGVVQLDVLADQTDAHGLRAVVDLFDHAHPLGHVRRRRFDVQLAADDVGEVVLFQHQRRLVQHGNRAVLDHAVGLYVAEQRDLLEDAPVDRLVAAQHNDVRRNAHALHLLDGVLGRLRLVLAGAFEVRHERDVDEDRILAANLQRNLADRLEERLAFDIARRAADLRDDHVRIRLVAHAVDEALDLVRDVRNDLHGLAEVFAAALLVQHVPVHLAGRQVREPVEVLVDEPLVVAEVEVRLRAVLGHVDLAVLVRAHRARVDIDIGIELFDGDFVAAAFEKASEGCRCNALAE